jgi:hypothetical protein
MKQAFLVLTLLISNAVFAKSVQDAFIEFYDSSEINSRLCGVNTQKFLQYLKDENITYDHAYVVSVHEGVGALNHFDARWGSTHRYTNGDTFSRSNWYFHVFAVIDGVAYDFSQKGKKTLTLRRYLKLAYYPKSETQPIFFLGKFTVAKAQKRYQNMEMKVYNAQEYRRKLGPVRHEGVFNELFNL